MQAPILEQLSEELDESELKIVKMDVDENPVTPQSFGVMSIPTLLFKKTAKLLNKSQVCILKIKSKVSWQN
jgi:thioredoxin 1